jgi:hypothetical protein
MPYKNLSKDLKEYFIDTNFEQIPKLNNRAANVMATIDSLLDIPRDTTKYDFLVEKILMPYFEVPESKFLCDIFGPSDPWYHKIFTYLKRGILLDNISLNLKKTFVKNSTHFFILGDTLYCRSIEGTLLYFLNPM